MNSPYTDPLFSSASILHSSFFSRKYTGSRIMQISSA